jgi:cyclophilin family peptidyl-prolyl cis-trans isomerase
VKGIIELELRPADAPRTVEHLVALFRRGFYRGLRFHRVNDALAQIGDPLTRDMSKRLSWGSGGSGNPVGVAEIARGRTHQRGSVAMAHAGDPRYADSQFYIMKRAAPSLDGKHTIVGRVITGLDVVDKIAVTDLIRNTSIKAAGPRE